MDVKHVPVRVSPINGGGISIYLPKELIDNTPNLLPHADTKGLPLESYHVVATYDPNVNRLTLTKLSD